jgi:hypothetical protein
VVDVLFRSVQDADKSKGSPLRMKSHRAGSHRLATRLEPAIKLNLTTKIKLATKVKLAIKNQTFDKKNQACSQIKAYSYTLIYFYFLSPELQPLLVGRLRAKITVQKNEYSRLIGIWESCQEMGRQTIRRCGARVSGD